MTASTPKATFRTLPLVGSVFAGVLMGVAAGYGVAQTAGWTSGSANPMSAPILAAIVWLFAAGLGVLMVIGGTAKVIERAGLVVVAASFLRMITALMLGIGAYFALRPEGKTFWTCFLLAGLVCLVAETVWAMRIMNSLQSPAASGSGSGSSAGVR